MKKFKLLSLVTALTLSTSLFTACGGSTGGEGSVVVPDGATSFTIEAEDTNLADYQGTEYSGSKVGYSAVKGSEDGNVTDKAMDTVSGGYFVGYFNSVGETITFVVNADKASTDNKLYINMGSEFGTLTVSPENISITVNGTELDYDSFKVKGSYGSNMGGTYDVAFTMAELGEIDLVEGENTIAVTVIKKDYNAKSELDEAPHGPGVDCIKIVTTSALTWEKLYDDYR